jgi:hypothetical protein
MEKLDAFPVHPTQSRYPWDQLLDGSVWKVNPGTDFGGKPKSFVHSARAQARRRGGTVRTRLIEDDVVLQFRAL